VFPFRAAEHQTLFILQLQSNPSAAQRDISGIKQRFCTPWKQTYHRD